MQRGFDNAFSRNYHTEWLCFIHQQWLTGYRTDRFSSLNRINVHSHNVTTFAHTQRNRDEQYSLDFLRLAEHKVNLFSKTQIFSFSQQKIDRRTHPSFVHKMRTHFCSPIYFAVSMCLSYELDFNNAQMRKSTKKPNRSICVFLAKASSRRKVNGSAQAPECSRKKWSTHRDRE